MSKQAIGIILFITVTVIVAFATGYWLGSEKNGTNHAEYKIPVSSGQQNTDLEIKLDDNAIGPPRANIGATSAATVPDSLNQQAAIVTSLDVSETLSLKFSDASINELLDILDTIGNSDDADDMSLLEPIHEALLKAVDNNPENFGRLIDYLVESEGWSQMPYDISSILYNTNIPDQQIYLNDLALRLSTQGTPSANTRLLHVLRSTGIHHENEALMSAIKNIALYSQSNDNNRINALDFLAPYQLNLDEKNKIVDELSLSLLSLPREEMGYVIENIIRFSDKTERTALATRYLSTNHNFETRIGIISSLTRGAIDANDSLKDVLFSIAENGNDPLNQHAKATLLYVFEIDNEEYIRLRNGG